MRETVDKSPSNYRIQLELVKLLVERADTVQKLGDSATPNHLRMRDLYHQEAFKRLKKMSSTGPSPSTDAQFLLAEAYGQGLLGLRKDVDRAFALYSQAARGNHPTACYRTAVCYEVGAGTRRDFSKAAQFYRKAASQSETAAMHKLGVTLLYGLMNQPKNVREGINWLKKAGSKADETTPHALYELAILHEGGVGDSQILPVSPAAYAYSLYLQAARLGHVRSQVRLGRCFEHELLGCPKDPRKSIAWYSEAASHGDMEAEMALAAWYLAGAPGVLIQSDEEAFKWASKSADKGYAKAEYAMGHFFQHGIGTQADPNQARTWYQKAAKNGNKKAIQKLQELGIKSPK
ncbi:uncharacterized protein BJ171DRAFT_429436 [Polychytrium aggregatum]|uniref:uncharacterized protein n=1 Tax=Polychytrium aggregatum TaxID=110093 RepID=UPI0022FE7C89|nr:uncharacterized protein BJ171DRAFT_429436 [Polychytrium aggregatum]KAI9193546.1 hypothetical protein BJ171DRAFT_429436 [Polychytrium aggregatum]